MTTTEPPIRLDGIVVADSYTLRRLSANAVKYRLGRQLDWRLDLMLDSDGLHLLSMRGIYILGPDRQVEWLFEREFDEDGTPIYSPMHTPTISGEKVVRTWALLKTPFNRDPLEAFLDLRLRDYMSLPPAQPRRATPGKRLEQMTSPAFDMQIRGDEFLPDTDTPDMDHASQKLIEEATAPTPADQYFDRRLRKIQEESA